jgi:hypothetical protein
MSIAERLSPYVEADQADDGLIASLGGTAAGLASRLARLPAALSISAAMLDVGQDCLAAVPCVRPAMLLFSYIFQIVKLSAYKRIGKILAGREKKIWRRKARKC